MLRTRSASCRDSSSFVSSQECLLLILPDFIHSKVISQPTRVPVCVCVCQSLCLFVNNLFSICQHPLQASILVYCKHPISLFYSPTIFSLPSLSPTFVCFFIYLTPNPLPSFLPSLPTIHSLQLFLPLPPRSPPSSRGRGISWRSVAHHRPLALGN